MRRDATGKVFCEQLDGLGLADNNPIIVRRLSIILKQMASKC